MSPPRNFIVLPTERAGGQQAQLDQRKFALLEALHELDADGAGGAGDGDDGILEVAFGFDRSMTFSMAPNEKAPLSFLAGPSVFSCCVDQRAQAPKAPEGLVLSVFCDRSANHGGET